MSSLWLVAIFVFGLRVSERYKERNAKTFAKRWLALLVFIAVTGPIYWLARWGLEVLYKNYPAYFR
jgi:hypothetical protein